MSREQKRITIAILIAAAVIAVVLVLRTETKDATPEVNSAPTVVQAPERSAIAITDKNGDGVPDWQEALVTVSPLELSEESSDYTPPETLTDQFAIDLFENMVRSKNNELFGSTPEEIAIQGFEGLASYATDELLTTKDIIVSSDNSPEALTNYGEEVIAIINRYPGENTEPGIVILERALQNQDAEELIVLDEHIYLYTKIFEETKMLAAPSAATQEHLDLVNTYQAIIFDLTAMRNAFADPAMALVRMKRYQDDATAFNLALENLYIKLLDRGATWTDSVVRIGTN